MSAEQFLIKWSKKEASWEGHYPDLKGKTITGALFGMISDFDEYLRKAKLANDLREYLKQGGYDPDTLKITCNKAN